MTRINFEAFVIAQLKAADFDAFADVPDGELVAKPSRFVTVEQTSGSTDGVAITTFTLAIQSWAPSRYEASQLAAEVDVAVFGIVNNSNPITHITRTSAYNFPTSQGEPRYQALYEMTAHLSKED